MLWLGLLLACGQTPDSGCPSCDADGDGIAREDDCDDNDGAVGLPVWQYKDADEDGYGSSEQSAELCPDTPFWSELGGDCDDRDPGVNPAAPEYCDGEDDDCDNQIDEGC
jgi:hypothetical protein